MIRHRRHRISRDPRQTSSDHPVVTQLDSAFGIRVHPDQDVAEQIAILDDGVGVETETDDDRRQIGPIDERRDFAGIHDEFGIRVAAAHGRQEILEGRRFNQHVTAFEDVQTRRRFSVVVA